MRGRDNLLRHAKQKGQEGFRTKGKANGPAGDGVGNQGVPWEAMATARDSGVKDKSAAPGAGSKGPTDADMNTFVRWGGAVGSYKEKWAISQRG